MLVDAVIHFQLIVNCHAFHSGDFKHIHSHCNSVHRVVGGFAFKQPLLEVVHVPKHHTRKAPRILDICIKYESVMRFTFQQIPGEVLLYLLDRSAGGPHDLGRVTKRKILTRARLSSMQLVTSLLISNVFYKINVRMYLYLKSVPCLYSESPLPLSGHGLLAYRQKKTQGPVILDFLWFPKGLGLMPLLCFAGNLYLPPLPIHLLFSCFTLAEFSES